MRTRFSKPKNYGQLCTVNQEQITSFMAKELTNTQKKEWAKTLYLKENLTQQEIADRVGVSRVSVSNWVRAGKWEEQRVGITLTREEQIRRRDALRVNASPPRLRRMSSANCPSPSSRWRRKWASRMSSAS